MTTLALSVSEASSLMATLESSFTIVIGLYIDDSIDIYGL